MRICVTAKNDSNKFYNKVFFSLANVYQTELHNACHVVASKWKMCVDA